VTPSPPHTARSARRLLLTILKTVAFTCAVRWGSRPTATRCHYLASWAEQSDLSVLEQSAALIDRLASRIEDAVLEAPPGQSKDDAPEVL
jgi:hypothetical protein